MSAIGAQLSAAPKLHPLDVPHPTGRAARRAAGQVSHRLFTLNSPRMRHGVDDNPRLSVFVRAFARLERDGAL